MHFPADKDFSKGKALKPIENGALKLNKKVTDSGGRRETDEGRFEMRASLVEAHAHGPL